MRLCLHSEFIISQNMRLCLKSKFKTCLKLQYDVKNSAVPREPLEESLVAVAGPHQKHQPTHKRAQSKCKASALEKILSSGNDIFQLIQCLPRIHEVLGPVPSITLTICGDSQFLLNNREVETGRSEIQGHHWLHRQFKSILRHPKVSLKKKKDAVRRIFKKQATNQRKTFSNLIR